MAKDTNYKNEIKRLRRKNKTIAEIGKKFGISQQRVYQILYKSKKWNKITEFYNFAYSGTTRLGRMWIKKGIPDLLTPKEASIILGVNPESMRRWNDRGLIKAIRIERGKTKRKERRFEKKEILRVLSDGLFKN